MWEDESLALYWAMQNYYEDRKRSDSTFTKTRLAEEWGFPPGTIRRWQYYRPPSLRRVPKQKEWLRIAAGQAMIEMTGEDVTYQMLAEELGTREDRIEGILLGIGGIRPREAYEAMQMIGPSGRFKGVRAVLEEAQATGSALERVHSSLTCVHKLTNRAVSGLLGLSESYVSDIRSGRRIPHRYAMSRILDLEAEFGEMDEGDKACQSRILATCRRTGLMKNKNGKAPPPTAPKVPTHEEAPELELPDPIDFVTSQGMLTLYKMGHKSVLEYRVPIGGDEDPPEAPDRRWEIEDDDTLLSMMLVCATGGAHLLGD